MKLILFDCDGTLVDSQAVQIETMRRTMVEIGEGEPDEAQTRSLIGVSLHETFAQLLKKPLGTGIDDVVLRFKAHYADVIRELSVPGQNHSAPYRGIVELLEMLGQYDEFLLGVVTGKSRKGLNGLFDKHDWHGRFVTTRTADDCPSKPHPAMVLECCGETGIEPAETLVIGDTTFDMQMACAAGARAIGVDWGYHPGDELVGAGAEQVIGTPSQLLQLI